MAEQTVTVGNATIVLSSIDDLFSDGRTTGYLEFYDERHRPLFPLTSQAVRDHLMAILTEPTCPELWRAGRITGWMEALMETARRLSGVPLQGNARSFCKMSDRRAMARWATGNCSPVFLMGGSTGNGQGRIVL